MKPSELAWPRRGTLPPESPLLAQWLLTEGAGAVAAANVGGAGINMALTGAPPQISWGASAAGAEIDYDGTLPALLAAPMVAPLVIDIHGSDLNTVTYEMVYKCSGSGGQCIFSMGQDGVAGIEMLWVPGNFFRLQALRCDDDLGNGNNSATWLQPTALASLGLTVIHAVIELPANTCTVYLDGVALPVTLLDGHGNHFNGLDGVASLALNDRSGFPGDDPCTGGHAYFAMYDGALSAVQCAAHAAALLLDNDVSPVP
jgi:hypothetical protein